MQHYNIAFKAERESLWSTYFHDRYRIVALTLLKFRSTAGYREPYKTYASHETQHARLMRDGNTKASVFTWLEFYFIKESVEMTEIPRLPVIRITFRYSRRDDLHEDAHLIVTNTLIAAYIRKADKWRYLLQRLVLFSTRLSGGKNVNYSLFVTDLKALFFARSCSLHQLAEQSFVGLNCGCISYVTSPTLKQMHIDLRAYL